MERKKLLEQYKQVRQLTMELVAGLREEDWRIQSMTPVSPHWWCLGHVSWFFTRNILIPTKRGTQTDEDYDYVLNSYYESLGPRIPQGERGLLSKPTNKDILTYRTSVDERITEFFETANETEFEEYAPIIEIGLHHEMQHQELLVSEIKHVQWQNPAQLRIPIAKERTEETRIKQIWIPIAEGIKTIGASDEAWTWDIEKPAHQTYTTPFEMSNKTVTNKEFIEFIEAGGYQNPLLWLSNGWEVCKQEQWNAPLYWYKKEGTWWHWTLQGDRKIILEEPVMHVSYYEAYAYARWASEHKEAYKGARLPTEQEWESFAQEQKTTKTGTHLTKEKIFHPTTNDTQAVIGGVWEWTTTEYGPYPRFVPYEGILMEYNEKFMDKQKVLRGGSIATAKEELRITNRNFWEQGTRFQFTGIRLARDKKH